MPNIILQGMKSTRLITQGYSTGLAAIIARGKVFLSHSLKYIIQLTHRLKSTSDTTHGLKGTATTTHE